MLAKLQYQVELYQARIAGGDDKGFKFNPFGINYRVSEKKSAAEAMITSIQSYISNTDGLLSNNLKHFTDAANNGELKDILKKLQALKKEFGFNEKNDGESIMKSMLFQMDQAITETEIQKDEIAQEIEWLEKMRVLHPQINFRFETKALKPLEQFCISECERRESKIAYFTFWKKSENPARVEEWKSETIKALTESNGIAEPIPETIILDEPIQTDVSQPRQ